MPGGVREWQKEGRKREERRKSRKIKQRKRHNTQHVQCILGRSCACVYIAILQNTSTVSTLTST